jgi:hypothetical protein
MKAGRLLYSRCTGEQVEMVYVDDEATVLKVMTWQEALTFATGIINHVAEIRAKEVVTPNQG